MLDDCQINDLIADTRATMNLICPWVQECAKGDVLNRELSVVVVLDPAAQRGLVWLICLHHLFFFFLSLIDCFANEKSYLFALPL